MKHATTKPLDLRLVDLVYFCEKTDEKMTAAMVRTLLAARVAGVENLLVKRVEQFRQSMLDALDTHSAKPPPLYPSRIITEPTDEPVSIWIEPHYTPGTPDAPQSGLVLDNSGNPRCFSFWTAVYYLLDANLAASRQDLKPGQLAPNTLHIVKAGA